MKKLKEHLSVNLILIPLVFIILMIFDFGGNHNFVYGRFYKKSTVTADETIVTKITEQTPDSLTIEFTNNGNADWVYSNSYSIEIYDKDVWCVVPFAENVMFVEIAYVLEPNQTVTKTYSLKYHTLYAGHYRLVVGSSIAEFDINKLVTN